MHIEATIIEHSTNEVHAVCEVPSKQRIIEASIHTRMSPHVTVVTHNTFHKCFNLMAQRWEFINAPILKAS